MTVTEDEQLIAALAEINGNESDANQFKELVEQSLENGMKTEEVLGDTAYLSAENIVFAESKEI